MIRIMFVCHGNICRSPMAEFVLKDMIHKEGLNDKITVVSSATSSEEIGNPVHYGTQKILKEHDIYTKGKVAVKLKASDYSHYNFLIGMDDRNIGNMKRLFQGDPNHKVSKLLSFVSSNKDIADPWYTSDFETTYDDVYQSCDALLTFIQKEYNL